MEMLVFALVKASWRLLQYFQAHLIKVLTKTPIGKIQQKLDYSGILFDWSIKLSKFNINYMLKDVTKGQTLADFVAKFTGSSRGNSFPWETLAGFC